MDFLLTEEQETMRRMARKFAEQEIMPVAQEYDEKNQFPYDLIPKLHETGLLTVGVPEEYDGPGLDTVGQAVVMEELSRGCAGVATTVAASCLLAADPVVIAGNHKQKERFFNVLNEGKLAAFCLTEPGAGSDVAALKTTAKLEGDEYVINGSKCFITNGGVADIFTVCASVDRSKGHKGLCFFIVEKDRPGVSVGKKENKLGIRSSSTTDVIFEDVRIPKENLLGKEGDGFKIAMKALDMSRPMVAALAVGVAQAAFEYASNYAKERVAFGKPIAALQGIQFMLAEMAMEIEAARLLIYKACWLRDAGMPYSAASSLAKGYAGDMAMKVTTDAVQILGGYGYIKEYPVEKYMRDAKIMQIYEGTSQVQRVVIAANVLK
ncbi:acyl-CoA dehydrogenase family protein [Desulfoscipio gibsoniae]|uniref:Acyl-CoA dehydrogenase n=1 Tax=Desulfoscipio gibsoniae DSM 7213 TaxID=767817 RepID=R4KTG9_9FIRM|nr:acyl-CoA dehydrogenase family protein [Desulfoscipio gibsoniae]AGL03900.1 acyl-CoA dehydrogenase [Desulfoscipio gibsoniae DSM 7213]